MKKYIAALFIAAVLCGCAETVSAPAPVKLERTLNIEENRRDDLENVFRLINEDRYAEAAQICKDAIWAFRHQRPGANALYLKQFKIAENYAKGMQYFEKQDYYKARRSLGPILSWRVPEGMKEHYETHWQAALDCCEQHFVQDAKDQAKAIDKKLDQAAELLKNDDLKKAHELLIELRSAKILSFNWRDSSYSSEENKKLYEALWDYYIIVHSAETGDYSSAYYLYDLSDTASLPKALRKKYEDAYAEIEKEYKKEYYSRYSSDYYSGSKKKKESAGHNHSYREDDDYDVYDYMDAEDFYYDNMDFFDSFEDAEDYFYEHTE